MIFPAFYLHACLNLFNCHTVQTNDLQAIYNLFYFLQGLKTMNAPVALTPELLTQLTAIVGENRIKTDADSLENWGRDHTKHFDPNPSVIVFPSSTEQVQAIVKLANQFNVAITPSGGRTGLSAGAVAANGEIVVSMDKMNQVLEFFPADRMVRVQAGVVTEQLQNYAEQ